MSKTPKQRIRELVAEYERTKRRDGDVVCRVLDPFQDDEPASWEIRGAAQRARLRENRARIRLARMRSQDSSIEVAAKIAAMGGRSAAPSKPTLDRQPPPKAK